MRKGLLAIALACSLLGVSRAQAQNYNYDVEGYGGEDDGYVYGEIDAYRGNRDVDGYIYDEDGEGKFFGGEWTGYGTVEGYDEDGNYYELETE